MENQCSCLLKVLGSAAMYFIAFFIALLFIMQYILLFVLKFTFIIFYDDE